VNMRKIISNNKLLYIILYIIQAGFLCAEDPFSPGYSPPVHDITTWTNIEINGAKMQNKVVTTYGFLYCKKRPNILGENLVVLLFKSKESLEAGFIEDSIRLEITPKTLMSYAHGDTAKWEKLHLQPAYVTGYYLWDKMNEANPRAHLLKEPLEITPPLSQLETAFWKQIKTKNMLWNK
jgi:hypothetical protein